MRLEEKGEGGDLLAKLENRDEVSSCDVLADILNLWLKLILVS